MYARKQSKHREGAVRKLVFVLALFAPAASNAHHSFSAVFDSGEVIEIEGKITRVVWANPHVRFSLQASGDNENWYIESHSVSILTRMQIGRDLLKPGDSVKLAGNPSRQPTNELFALNALLPGGEEIVFDPRGEPRWGSERVGSNRYWVEPDVIAGSEGIYRVWSTVASDPESFPLIPEGFDPAFDINSYPLTQAAQRVVAAFNPVTDAPTLNCNPKGMPTIMEQPYPMEFVEQGASIELRIEEYDTVRTIHLDDTSASDQSPSRLGHSVGRFEGETLVVTTTRINWPHFDTVGIPLSQAVEVTEWFAPSDDGSRLNYRIRVTDPATFTESVELEKYWLAVPGIEVRPYNCTQ